MTLLYWKSILKYRHPRLEEEILTVQNSENPGWSYLDFLRYHEGGFVILFTLFGCLHFGFHLSFEGFHSLSSGFVHL